MLRIRTFIFLIGMILLLPLSSGAQDLIVFKSSDPNPSNAWTTWENIARPWFMAEFGRPFEHMIILVTNVDHGGTYEKEFNTVRQPEAWQWIDDLPTGRYRWFARFEYWDGPSRRWSDFYEGPGFYVDRSAPGGPQVSSGTFPTTMFSFTTPWTTRSDLTFTWPTPGDAGSGISNYQLSVNDGAWQNVASGYSPSLTTGTHKYAFRAVDNVGLVSAVNTKYARVDYSPPTCSPNEAFGRAGSSPSHSWTKYAGMHIRFNGSDAGSGVKYNYISVDEGGYNGTLNSEAMVTVSDGLHTFDIKVADEAGQESAVRRLYARVDGEQPVVSITRPLPDTLINCDSLILCWTGSDGVSGISRYLVELDGGSNINVGLQTTDTIRDLAEGSHQLVVAAVDQAMNYTLDTVNFYVDRTAPVISSCHSDLQIPGDDNCEIVLQDYTGEVTASDEHSAEVTVVQTPAAGKVLTGPENEVTLEVSDEAGNASAVSFNIEVTDEIAPLVSFASDRDVLLDGDCNFSLPDYTLDSDLVVTECSGYATVQEPAPGTVITDTTTVTLTVTDDAGNSAACHFSINTIDDTDPVIECIADQEVTIESGETAYTVSGGEFDPGAWSDNCGEVSLANDLNQGSSLDGEILGEGTTTITWTATDAFGNSVSCATDLTVSVAVGISGSLADELSVYPNPTPGMVRVVSPVTISQLEVTDLSGKVIHRSSECGARCTIDLSSFESGVYFVRAQVGSDIVTQMVVKE